MKDVENNKGQANQEKLNPSDILKYEIAEELGLMDKIDEMGWKGLTAKESGKVGGLLAGRIRELRSRGVDVDKCNE